MQIKVAIWLNSHRPFLIHAPLLLLSVDFLSSLFPQVCAALVEWDSHKNVSNLVAKRQIYTCASYGEGCSLEKPNDCLRAAQQCLSRWWSTCHVCSIPFCLSAHLPSSHSLSSFTLPFTSISQPSWLPRSFLSLTLSLSVSFLSTSPSVTMDLCILQPLLLLSPEWAHLLTQSTTENKRIVFSLPVHHSSFFLPSSLHTYWIENQHTHTPMNTTVGRFCLWQRKAISGLFQSSVITWSVSLSGACFIRPSPWLKPFWETENIISYDLLWYKSKLLAVNPIHNYSSL